MKQFIKIIFVIILLSNIAFCLEAIDGIPIDAKIEYNNALDLYKLGKYEEAISGFRTAIRLYPDFIDAYYNLGSILEYLNQGDEAIYILKQIIARKPDDYEAVYKIANIAAKSGDRYTASQYITLIPATSEYYVKGKELTLRHGLSRNVQLAKQNKPKSSAMLNIQSPTGIASDKEGNVYIASFSDNIILKVTPENKRIVFFKDKILKGPISIAIDNKGNMYIANYNANNVLKISKDGKVDILIEKISKPYSLHIGNGLLYISSQGSNTVFSKRI